MGICCVRDIWSFFFFFFNRVTSHSKYSALEELVGRMKWCLQLRLQRVLEVGDEYGMIMSKLTNSVTSFSVVKNRWESVSGKLCIKKLGGLFCTFAQLFFFLLFLEFSKQNMFYGTERERIRFVVLTTQRRKLSPTGVFLTCMSLKAGENTLGIQIKNGFCFVLFFIKTPIFF